MAEEFQEDFFQRIQDVNWGTVGGIFVAVGNGAFTVTTKIKNTKDEIVFTDLGELAYTADSGFVGGVSGVGYYKYPGKGKTSESSNAPIFVSAGFYVIGDGSGTAVMYSEDGSSWITAFKQQWPSVAGPDPDSAAFAIALDKETFYVGAYADIYYSSAPIQVRVYDKLLSSPNGTSWSETGSLLRWDSGGSSPFDHSPPSLFMPHVNPKTKLPEGRAVVYEKKNSSGKVIERYFGKPVKTDPKWWSYATAATYIDPPKYGSAIQIEIIKAGKTSVNKMVSTPLTLVIGVAYAGGVWMVGGSDGAADQPKAAIAASVDDGDTWKVVWNASGSDFLFVTGIVGGPLVDFPPDVRK